MDDNRKKKEDSNWSLGLGIAAGITAGVGLLGLGYKLWKDNTEKKEETVLHGSGAHALYGDEESDDSDDFYSYSSRTLDIPARHGWSTDAEHCLNIRDIGTNFNDWRIPKELTISEMNMATQFCDASQQEFNISEIDWKKATGAVDKVLGLLMKEILKEAGKYEGLAIDKYVKQGSSREGLKVGAADEFDVLLQYHFENLDYEVVHVSSGGYLLPELAYFRVDSTMSRLSQTHSRLYKKDVFTEMDGEPYINTRNLQEKVFTSLIASASSVVAKNVNQGNLANSGFKLKIRTNPPSVNIGIEFTDEDGGNAIMERLEYLQLQAESIRVQVQGAIRKIATVIDVDIVPGLRLSDDKVPDPTNKRRTMTCPTYAVFKWLTEDHRSASRYGATPSLLWRICSSGYEKHVIDVAKGKSQQRHIVNALRFLKLYFRNMKKKAIERHEPPPQVVTVLRSYHLKHIAFYCILFLRVLNKVRVSHVDVALAYMLAFLEVCLDERKLPHFFHANSNITSLFPDFTCKPMSLRYDLFQGKDRESFNQAMRSYRLMKTKMSSVIMYLCAKEMGSLVSDDIVDQFRNYVSSGHYYQ